MGVLHATLGLPDTDRQFVNTIGQRVVYDAVVDILNRHNEELNAFVSVFAEMTTEDYKLRYKLPGSGRLARRGGQTESPAAKATGQWDIALPLEDFGRQLSGDDVSMAYMRMDEMDRHIMTIMNQNVNTVRFEMLRALFNNTQRTFVDPLYGDLLVEPLANGDAVLYPPILGSETNAADDHYIESNYTAITDANNPYDGFIVPELEEHFGIEQGGSSILTFINRAQVAATTALADFDEVTDRFVTPGDDTATVFGTPNVPGRVIGRTNGTWVAQWDWIPAGYLLGVHLDAPRPLMQRVDPEATGLPQGLTLVVQDTEYPFEKSHYRNRFGIGVGNRLNGVVVELGVGGTYTIPPAYL